MTPKALKPLKQHCKMEWSKTLFIRVYNFWLYNKIINNKNIYNSLHKQAFQLGDHAELYQNSECVQHIIVRLKECT